jgi:phage protein D
MQYNIIVDGVDVTERLEIVNDTLFVTDRAGAKADNMKMLVSNMSDFQLQKGQRIAVKFGGFTSGNMTVDQISPNTLNALVEAVSSSAKAKKKRSRHYRKVRFFDVINDVALETGFSVFYIGSIENRYYENVSRWCETPLAFLNRLCIREGYGLKVDDSRIIVYEKRSAEAVKSVLTITQGDLINNQIQFIDNTCVTEAVKVQYFDLKTGNRIEHTAGIEEAGEQTEITEYVSDIAEAERFARGYSAEKNKNCTTVIALIPINTDIAATSNIDFEGFGRYDGKYHIEEITHCPIAEQTKITARKIS